MLQTTIIGYIGSDAECKSYNGKEFTTFRVSHSDRWKDESGVTHDNTTWVDCVINGRPAVMQYLVKGALVYCSGTTQLRVYSSPKDKCMKAGITINVRSIELVGGKPDPVPNILYRADDGTSVPISKHYFAIPLIRDENQPEFIALVSAQAKQFVCDRNGNVTPYTEPQS